MPAGVRRPRAPEGPVLPRGDREPRSLEEAGFRRRKNGSYNLSRLDTPVTAIVHSNGRIEFRDVPVTLDLELVDDGRLSTKEKRLRFAGLSDSSERHRAIKGQIVRETAALRLRMAQTWSREQIRTQLAALRKQLQRTWARVDWSAARRRQRLFTLWDDCEEAPERPLEGESVDATLDGARIEGGEEGRAITLEFIRDELPKASPDAYGAAELKALNAGRRSRQRFEPY